MIKSYLKFLLVFFLLINCNLNAQWAAIPDTNFVNWLNNNGYAGCMNGNLMDTTCNAIVTATTLVCNGVGLGIKNLDGLQYFDSLLNLYCYNHNLQASGFPVLHAPLIGLSLGGNFLTSLPLLPSTIKMLNCQNENLNSITALPDSLVTFICENNQLSSLPPLPNGVTSIYCEKNQLVTLPSLPPNIAIIYAQNNFITSLPPLPPSLKELYVYNNLVSSLPVLPSSLKLLFVYHNLLSSLPSLPSSLESLDCSNNQLTSLPALPANLKQLGCNSNNLTSLPPLPLTLRGLICDSTQITVLPSLPDTLRTLSCSATLITSLPPLPDTLYVLACNNSLLTSLPSLPSQLYTLRCNNSQLKVFPVMSNKLVVLECSFNKLTSLPSLSSSLRYLICNDNQLTNLPDLPASLSSLYCQNNQISCLPVIPNSVAPWNFDITPNLFTCLPNYTAAMDSTLLAMPLCQDNDVINNPNACPTIKGVFGYTYQDLNGNCLMGSADGQVNNIPVQLYDSTGVIKTYYTLNNGAYNYILDSGAYTVSIDTSGKPFTFNCNDPGLDSTFTLTSFDPLAENINFEIACKPGFDVGVQSIHNTAIAFPGMPHQLQVAAGNISLWNNLNCASGISGSVVITVNGPVTYDSIPVNALVPSNIVNNTFTYNVADFGILNLNAFAIWFTTNTTAQTGNSVCVSVEVITSASDNDTTNNYQTFCYNVRNSYDPNDKQVFPVTVAPPYNDYFTYTIRFQNTGSAPAQNVRIIDSLDNKLDLSTFEIINYSHPNTSTLINNVATFRFPSIQLPDSATNPEGSKGFIQYKIKPILNLSLGTQINNTADIYFDFNSPITTNNALSIYSNTSGLSNLAFENSVCIYPNPSKGIYKLRFDKSNFSEKNIEIINSIGERIFQFATKNNSETINLSLQPAGIYFLSVRTNGNLFNLKIVKE